MSGRLRTLSLLALMGALVAGSGDRPAAQAPASTPKKIILSTLLSKSGRPSMAAETAVTCVDCGTEMIEEEGVFVCPKCDADDDEI